MKKYEIHPVETSKDSVKQPPLVQAGVLPRLGSSTVIVGKSGSGKTVLLYNLLTRKEFYHGWFDKTIIISPTAEMDDIQRALKVPPSCTYVDLDEALLALAIIEQAQSASIKKHGAAKTKQICIIFDDCVGHTKFMASAIFTACFIRSRHMNATVFFLTQSFMRLPKICRLQASFIAFFQMSNAEMQIAVDEYCPAGMTAAAFERMLTDVLGSEQYQFFVVNMRVPNQERYRRGLGEILNLKDYM